MNNTIDPSKRRRRFRVVIPAYPAFNIYSRVARKTTALGPVCIASVVNEMEGWDVEVIDENNLRLYGPRAPSGGADHDFLQNRRPADVVGLYGGLTSAVPRLYEIARFYRERGVATIAGGQHFVEDNVSEALRSKVDYVVVGEGELTIRELLRTLQEGGELSRVRGIAYLDGGGVVMTDPREPITDFDALPHPDFSLVRYAKLKLYPVGRIRGCGMDCEFCTVKGKPRWASPERLLEDIRLLLETRDARHFFIVDDLFGQVRGETIRFCRMLRDYQRDVGRRLDITVQIRLDKARDPELLSAMRAAGINTVAIGFESPIEEELLAMRKRIKPRSMIALARAYHDHGFLVHGMFIFGYPLKEGVSLKLSMQDRIKTYREFIRESRIDTMQVLLPVPLPGTELRRRLEEQGRIYPRSRIGWEFYDGCFPTFEPDEPVTAQELQASAYRIMGRFYRFKYMFVLALHVVSFACMLFYLHNIKVGWKKWYRQWRNSLNRFGGWIAMRGWTSQLQKGGFPQELKRAQEDLTPIRRVSRLTIRN